MTPSSPPPDVLVLTDLDGTLLTHAGYDPRPARRGLEALARRRIPVGIASSKTAAEIRHWRLTLDLTGPWICENGGALWAPANLLPTPPVDAWRDGDGWRRDLGAPITAIRAALSELALQLGTGLEGFGTMPAGRVAELTGLSGDTLAWARAREFDEPFVAARPLSSFQERTLARLAAERGLTVTKGGRFYHLLGHCDKGRAAAVLREWLGGITLIAVGDADNDLELLQAADRAIIVARPDGSHTPMLRAAVPGGYFTTAPGPEGFSEGILAVLEARA